MFIVLLHYTKCAIQSLQQTLPTLLFPSKQKGMHFYLKCDGGSCIFAHFCKFCHFPHSENGPTHRSKLFFASECACATVHSVCHISIYEKEFCFFFKTIANGYSIITRGKCVSIIQMTEFQVINYFPDKLN